MTEGTAPICLRVFRAWGILVHAGQAPGGCDAMVWLSHEGHMNIELPCEAMDF